MRAGLDRTRLRRIAGTTAAAAAALVITACGGGGDDSSSTDGTATSSQRAAAVSLQQAMNTASGAIDDVRGTRASLERLGATLQPTIAQTGDVIGVLTPKAGTDTPEALLLTAARQQRTFLQFAHDSTDARSRAAATSALARARAAGQRATAAYAVVAQKASALAGLLPASTTFNTGRLRDAVRAVYGTSSGGSTSGGSSSGGSTSGGSTSGGSTSGGSSGTTNCGGGVSVNSVTSCSFADNVAQAYRDSGGASTVDAYSPKTGQVYTMTCTDQGITTVCRGGNNAVVSIR